MEILRIAARKHDSYLRRGIFQSRPIILLGNLNWPDEEIEGPAIYDVHEELTEMTSPGGFRRVRVQ